MTPAELDRLAQIAEAASPGPWECSHFVGATLVLANGDTVAEAPAVAGFKPRKRDIWKLDAAHIAAFNPQTALRLIQEVRHVRAILEALVHIAPGTAQINDYDRDEMKEYSAALRTAEKALDPDGGKPR